MFTKVDDCTYGNIQIEKYFAQKNGLNVILLNDPSVPIFAYHTWFHVGSKNETKGTTGIAHLFEHLMFKETKNKKEGEFDRLTEKEGGSINAATYMDWTFYRETMPKAAFELVAELESDRMKNVILNEKQLESEREVVMNERRMRVDNSPSGKLNECLYKVAFENHPYHHPVIGWMEDIASITLENCFEFYQTYYAPNNATIVVVGDIPREQALTTLERFYGSIPSSVIPKPSFATDPVQTQLKFKQLNLTIPTPKILLGYHIPNMNHPDHSALSVLQSLLTDGKSSRLYQTLLATNPLVSEIDGWTDQTELSGLQIFQFSLKKNIDPQTVIDQFNQTLSQLITQGPSEAELQKVKNQVETSFWSHFSTCDEKAQAIGFYELVTGRYQNLFKKVDDLSKVTAPQVVQVAKKYLTTQNLTTILGNPES